MVALAAFVVPWAKRDRIFKYFIRLQERKGFLRLQNGDYSFNQVDVADFMSLEALELSLERPSPLNARGAMIPIDVAPTQCN
nr:hypothetical protein [Collimonas fungivorans]